jgi:hypothetical protein
METQESKRPKEETHSAVAVYDDIVHIVQLYIDGAAKGDANMLREAFHLDARMFGQAGSMGLDMPISSMIEQLVAHPADTGSYKARVISVNHVGDAAVAVLAEDGFWGTASFVDFFSLTRTDGRWKIVNKTFAITGGTLPPM